MSAGAVVVEVWVVRSAFDRIGEETEG